MEISNSPHADPHCLQLCGAAVFAVYTVAKSSFTLLRKKAIGIDEVQARLRHKVPHGPFRSRCHARVLWKLINPHGHGANGVRFQNATLQWFRNNYPEDAVLTDALALFVCACKWWAVEQGRRTIYTTLRPLGSSDFDAKLEELGFLEGERNTLLRVFRYSPE